MDQDTLRFLLREAVRETVTEVFARYKRMTGEVAVCLGLGVQSGPGWLGSSPARGAW